MRSNPPDIESNNVSAPDRSTLLEHALRGYLSLRCKRAYAHEMRNGLQGIYGGVDALTRAARPDKPSVVPLERLTQFVQHAIGNHERGLEQVLNEVAGEEQPTTEVAVKPLLIDLLKFLTHDIARHGVHARLEVADELTVRAPPTLLRMMLLGLLTDAIDATPSGTDIHVCARPHADMIQIEVSDARAEQCPETFVMEAVAVLAARLSGRIDRSRPPTGHCVSLQLPTQ